MRTRRAKNRKARFANIFLSVCRRHEYEGWTLKQSRSSREGLCRRPDRTIILGTGGSTVTVVRLMLHEIVHIEGANEHEQHGGAWASRFRSLCCQYGIDPRLDMRYRWYLTQRYTANTA